MPQGKTTEIVDSQLLSRYPGIPLWLCNFKVQAILVGLLALICNANTFSNEYAFDDAAVIVQNEFVHQGFAGIPDILTKDAYYSYYNQLNSSDQLSGGRYRPLSLVTFAIEQQFFGAVSKGQTDSVIAYGISYDRQAQYEKRFITEMHIRHVFNVLWYGLLVITLLYFLRTIVFRDNPLLALIATVVFTIHPIHTEVVANVKSRDEIMSLLFICLTFIFAFKYDESKKKGLLLAGLVSYFLAFLSKEYAITLVVLLPIAFYIFNNYTIRRSLVATLPYLAVVAIYAIIRWKVTGPRNELSDTDIQINPYALASSTEKLATEISTALNYLKLLFIPHPLSSDYSYNQIPYKDFSNIQVWLSLAVHAGLLGAMVWFLKKRSIWCFAIAFYLVNLAMVCNIFFDIGATMGERLIFHSSVGFCIGMACLLYEGIGKVRAATARKYLLACAMLLIIVSGAYATIARNRDWKNNDTLYFHDVNVSPNSFLMNMNVAALLVNRSDFEQDQQLRLEHLHRAVTMFTKVLTIQNNYVLAYMNRAVAYLKLEQPDSMKANLDTIYKLYPIHPQLPEMYYHDGMLYYSKKLYSGAEAALTMSLKLNPNARDAQNALIQAKNALDSAQNNKGILPVK